MKMHVYNADDNNANSDNDDDNDANDDYDDNRTGCTSPSTPRAFISFYNLTQLTANWLNKWWWWFCYFKVIVLRKPHPN